VSSNSSKLLGSFRRAVVVLPFLRCRGRCGAAVLTLDGLACKNDGRAVSISLGVIFLRSGFVLGQPGFQKYRKHVKDKLPEWSAATASKRKEELAIEIMQGRRFYRQDEATRAWVPVANWEDIVERIMQAFRDEQRAEQQRVQEEVRRRTGPYDNGGLADVAPLSHTISRLSNIRSKIQLPINQFTTCRRTTLCPAEVLAGISTNRTSGFDFGWQTRRRTT
jgi:hypothetical protein